MQTNGDLEAKLLREIAYRVMKFEFLALVLLDHLVNLLLLHLELLPEGLELLRELLDQVFRVGAPQWGT